jgi:plasmid stabilization system protein ParE
VTVEVQLQDGDFGTEADDQYIEMLEGAIQERLASAPRAGRWEGHEFGGGWAVIYCYGRDGARLSDVVLDAVLPIHGNRQLCVIGSAGKGPQAYTVLLSRSRHDVEVTH